MLLNPLSRGRGSGRASDYDASVTHGWGDSHRDSCDAPNCTKKSHPVAPEVVPPGVEGLVGRVFSH